MRKLFADKDERGGVERAVGIVKRYFHPVHIATGALFSAAGVGIAAAGVLYSDGINFLLHGMPAYVAGSNHTMNVLDYLRESYKGSFSDAIAIGWKQAPLSYCAGHYVGMKVREKVSRLLGGGR